MGQVIKFPVASRRADARRVRHLDEALRELKKALPGNEGKESLDEATVSLIGRAVELGGTNQVAKLLSDFYDPSVEEPAEPELSREDQATAFGYSRGRGIKGSAYEETKSLSTTEISKLIRKDIKAAKKAGKLPKKLKVSVRTRNYSGGSSIDISVKDSPVDLLNPERIRWDKEHPYGRLANDDPEFPVYTEEGARILELLKSFHSAYNRDNSDTMTDYFDVRYYGSVGIDWKYRNELHERALSKGAC